MARKKRVVIIGAGPGGLSAGMLLSAKGYKVSIYEQHDRVGGRNASIKMGGFVFDTGPTFLMMKFVLDNLFKEAGKDINNYLSFVKIDPMYRLMFKDKVIMPTGNTEKMKAEIEKYFPAESSGLDKFKKNEKIRFDKLYPCLERDYSSILSLFSSNLLKAIPYTSLGSTVFDQLGKYFKSEDLKVAFTFQAKYLGMSAWNCPGLFTMLPFIEHDMGVYHVIGGLNKISEAMAKVIMENSGEIILNTRVDKIIKKGRKAQYIKLDNGQVIETDAIVINADFAHAMTNLFNDGELKKYTKEKLESKKYSCSTFMLYLGLKKQYLNTPHHTIVFSEDYHKNVIEIFETKKMSLSPSIYIQNACVTDNTLAPAGKSGIYILVPVPNKTSGIDWDKEKAPFRNLILKTISQRTEMKDLEANIEEEKIFTPKDWEAQKSVFNGATFNLAHNIGQMLYLRPHNRFEECDNCYIVGGGTHPGSGLPTIYESAKISVSLLEKDLR